VSITKNPQDAEDALQDTFLRAYLALGTFEGRCKIYTWLTRIAINSALMFLRKQRARAELLVDPQPHPQLETLSFEVRDSAPNPEEAYEIDQRQLKTLRAIRRLDPHLRAPIRMQMMHGWSIKTISRALNISEAAVKSRLYRARQRLSAADDINRPAHRGKAVGKCVIEAAASFVVPSGGASQVLSICDRHDNNLTTPGRRVMPSGGGHQS